MICSREPPGVQAGSRPQLFEKWMALFIQWINYAIGVGTLIHSVVIFLVDSAIQLFNNRGLIFMKALENIFILDVYYGCFRC